MMEKVNASALKISGRFPKPLRDLLKHRVLIMFLIILLIYIRVWVSINSLNNVQPSQSAVQSQFQAAPIPHVSPSLVQQLKSLQDNSVNVKALFNQSRS